MTRKEAIAYFESRRNYNPHDGDPEAERLALAALRAQQELESKPLNGWISVKDRLPEPKHEFDARNWYLVALSNGVVKELAYEFNNNSVFGYGWRETAYPVTHWQPMPEPPQTERMEQ